MSGSRKKHVVICALLLVAATFAFYNPIVHNKFIDFDDQHYILNNYHIHGGLTWDAVKWSFTTFRDGNYHPLTWMSHALDCQLFHLNPVGHHYSNLLLHVLSTVLLFLLLQRATGFTWASLLVAALFALHPVNVESVAWAAERKNVLSMLIFLLALHAYDRYGRTGQCYLYWCVVGLFALGLMAKAQIVTLPFVLLLWDYWPLQRMEAGSMAGGVPAVSTFRSFRYLVWEKAPLFFLAAADSVVTVMAQRAGSTIRTLSEIPLSLRLENMFVSYVRYIGKAFWPSQLALLYPRPERSLPFWQWAGATALIVLLSAVVIRWRDRRYLLVGWCWFLGTLVPMIGIVTVGEQAMADRYAYLPFIGLFVAVVWALTEFSSARRIRSEWLAASAVSVLLIFGCLTYRQLGYWRDSETLWRYTLSVTERNYMAHSNLALALANQGRADEAIVQLRAAKALHQYPPTQILAMALYELQVGRPQDAIQECNSVLHATDPASTDPKVQAVAWGEVGQAQLQLRHYDQSAESYQTALRLNPEDGTALMGVGVTALREGRPDVAVTQLLHAVKVDPTDVNVLLLAQALRRAGRTADADAATAQVQKISPNLSQAQIAAGQILTLAGVQPL